jgi:hypothetical protein
LFRTCNHGLLLTRNVIDKLQTLSLGAGYCFVTGSYP